MTTVQLKTTFDLNPANDENVSGTFFLDLAQIYSLVNRIGLRQGMQYAFANIEFQCQAGGTLTGSIYKLPESWPCVNAFVKAHALWDKQQDLVLENEPSIAAKYRDFKVYYNKAHETAGVASNLIPMNYAIAGTSAVYDWEMSEFVFPASGLGVPGTEEPADTKNVFMIGDDSHSAGSGSEVGIIHGYAMSRSRPQDVEPNTPTGDWMTDLFDDGENLTLIRNDVKNQNDEAPYLNAIQNTAYEYYPGGAAQGSYSTSSALENMGEVFDIVGITSGTGTLPGYYSDATGPGTALLGLLAMNIEATGVAVADHSTAFPVPSGLTMTITMIPGDYKGFAALPMKEVN